MPEEKTTTVVRKIPGGKLLQLEITIPADGSRISRIKITGDFFLHPEEALEQITATIRSAVLPLNPEALTAQLTQVLRDNHAEAIGFSPADLSDMLREALA